MNAETLRQLATVVDAQDYVEHLDFRAAIESGLAELAQDRVTALRACDEARAHLESLDGDPVLARGLRLLAYWATSSRDYDLSQLGIGLLMVVGSRADDSSEHQGTTNECS